MVAYHAQSLGGDHYVEIYSRVPQILSISWRNVKTVVNGPATHIDTFQIVF